MKRLFMTACVFLALVSLAFAQIDYNSQVQPIFNSSCAGQCHGSNSGVTLTSYAATIASVGNQYGTLIVVPGDTGASPLWDKINPNPLHGNVMPVIRPACRIGAVPGHNVLPSQDLPVSFPLLEGTERVMEEEHGDTFSGQ